MAKKVKSLKRIKLALFTAVFVACGIPTSTLSEIKIAQADEVVEANNGSTLAGEGTVTSPYLIATKSGLEKFRDIVIGANGETRNSAAHARLVANIDLENSSWEPIGSYYYIYQGTFDGAGHTVSGLNVNKPSTSRVGFFGYIKNATIKNLTLQGSVVGSQMVGGVVGQMGDYSTGNSTVYNCINECSVHSTFVPSKSYDNGGKFGGIVGCVDGGNNVVSKCTNRGAITTNATGDTSSHAGGIVGYAGYKPITIKNCVNTGNITATAYSAGIVSYVSGADVIITGCFNHGIINNVYEFTDSRGSSYTGGIVAHAYGKDDNHIIISHCGNTGTVYGRRACNGGVAAEAYRCDVSNCYNTGNVTGTTACGVICNGYYMNLTNAYNTGAIRSLSDRSDITSGVLGSTSNSHISYVYNYGSVANASGVAYPYTRRGSIAGDIGSNSTATSTYFLDGTYHTGIGTIGNNSTGYSTKLSAAQMRTQSSFSGWDFNNVWVMGDNYPLLRHSHDFNVVADQSTHTLTARCERPYCDHSDKTYTLTLHAPTLERERSGGNANATLDAEELAEFNAGTGLNVSADNITYEKIENNQTISLGTTAPTTYGDYTVKLTVGNACLSYNYSIAKLNLEFTQDVVLNGESSTTTVSNLNGETAATLLTDAEIEQYLDGKSVSINLKVTTEEGDLNIPAPDKDAVKESLSSSTDVKEGAYLDVSLFKQVGDEEATEIHESATAFNVTVDIPQDIAAPYGVDRTYSIMRVHNGVVETIPCTVTDGRITFSTDKFSTYLIAYNDNYDEEGEHIEFTVDVVGEDTLYVDNSNVGDKINVTYKITHNSGFNSILLIPQYDTNVFAINKVTVNNDTALGAATITNGDGVKKILLENTGDKYTALDGDNEFFLTVEYTLLAPTAGEYNFGLNLNGAGDNNYSAAYYIAEGEQKGEQTRVPLIVNEPTLTLVAKKPATIEIGTNTTVEEAADYIFTYSKTAVGVEKVTAFPSVQDSVKYTYNGDATPVIKWYQADFSNNSTYPEAGVELESAPMYAGDYVIGISAPAGDEYYAVSEVFAYVHINPLTINVTIDDKASEYGDDIVALTSSSDHGPFEGDSFNIVLTTTATKTSNVGTYSITGAANSVVGSYEFEFTSGTYTINKKVLTVTASDQNAQYTGNEPTVDQLAYTVSIGGLTISGVTITKAPGVNVGNYKLTIAYENDNYDLHLVDGTFTITSAGADVEAIKALFGPTTKVYNGQEQNLLTVSELLPDYITYEVTGNMRTDVGVYSMSVTATLDPNHAIEDNPLVFVVEGAEITPASVTITANDIDVHYGQNPVEPTGYSVSSGEVFGTDNLHIGFDIKNGDESFAPTTTTNVGSYDIVVVAENSNYDITLVDGKYNVLQATADMINIVVNANDTYYNREFSNSITVTVNENVVLDNDAYTVSYTDKNGIALNGTPVDADDYYFVVTVNGTDNYVSKTAQDAFAIKKVQLEGVEFTYSHDNVTWSKVENDTGKTSTEDGVEAKELKEGTTVTYYVYDGNTLVGTYNERSFDALTNTTYKVVVVADNSNYISSESEMIPSYKVSFNGNDPDTTDIPAAVYVFSGETLSEDPADPELTGKSFVFWSLNDQADPTAASTEAYHFTTTAVTGNVTVYAIWSSDIYKITFLYLPDSNTLNTDKFVFYHTYGQTVGYDPANVQPVKPGEGEHGAGITYEFAGKWAVLGNSSVEYTVDENGNIQDFTVPTESVTFVAVYTPTVHEFTITYYFSDNESTTGYTAVAETQTVKYGATIDYLTYGENISWFKADYWYGDAERTTSVPSLMPDENISVYGTYKFDIGLGDVNADGRVTTDDITLYRQYIVGGYTMTVVEKGDEWNLVNSQDFDPTARYYLKRVADNNLDNSRDVRDVSITRMSIVGGYDWDISTGTSVSGQGINRTVTVTSINGLIDALGQSGGRARIYNDLAGTETAISIAANKGDLYLDLNGHTLTVNSLALSTNGINATITVRNGTIVTTDGITIVAPNGNVIIEDVIGYINESQVNLQAADNSLHLAGTVKFYRTVNEQNVPAPINVEEGTHVVIEQNAAITIEKIVVTENFAPNSEGEVTLDNNTDTQVIVDGNVKNYTISTLAELIEAIDKGGDYGLAADIIYSGTLVVSKDVSINLNGHTLRSSNSVAIQAVNGATLTLSGNGNVIAQEACVMAFDGSSIVINGGTYTALDNFVIGTNGTAGRGNNNITINGGTFNGGIQTAGYVACGIYVANNDTVVVNGGTFNVVDGVGILARSGQTYVADGVVFNLTHSDNPRYYGWVGDNKFNIPTLEIVTDPAANYPGGTPSVDNQTSYGVWSTKLVSTKDEFIAATEVDYTIIILANDIDIGNTDIIIVDRHIVVDLNNHTLNFTGWGLEVDNPNGLLIMQGPGQLNANEAALYACYGANLIVNGGTYTSRDNFVIGTNGTAGKGNNNITINGGTFNGGIQTAGYVACGIYVANNDTVVVNGGTFNITNGCGILARSGSTTVNSGVVFNVVGDGSTGKVGDSYITVPTGKVLVLDLAANYPGGEPTLVNNSAYKVAAVVESLTEINAVKNNVSAIVLANDITSNYYNPIVFVNDMDLYLNGKTITCTDDVALRVSNGATLTIYGNGNVVAQEACVMAFNGSKIVINGGTYTSRDNFVIGTNGNPGQGNNNITINAGTFNGGIQSAGYVACGIYVANSDTVVVNGGTFNITNGCGILSRSGNTTVNEDAIFNVNGSGIGKVGDSSVVVPAGQALVLDLKANYPGGTPIINNNSSYNVYVIVDGTYTFVNDDASFHAARGVYDNVILTADLNDYLYVNKDMNVYLNGHTVDVSNSGNVAIYVVEGAKLTINGDGLIKSREGCVIAFDGSEFIINGGTYTALDNFVFGTNGTAGRGENKITINGGVFNGQIISEGYVACGIYVANSDTVVVNGGTFTITNGCGILSRSGNTTINNGVVINATGSGIGKVGDSSVVVPAGQALVRDLQANYPGGTPILTNNSSYSVYTIEA